ncbi:MAG: DNA polymerase [Robiginitomaculum sp.]|nr:MAG: DNA polymerase [Robiginitomaculum sp.]
MNDENFIWCEKYRPKTIEDTILPSHLKTMFLEFIKKRNVPNLLLVGTAGIGKTTVAKALLNELDSDYIVINGSMDNGIDILRTKISNFASSVSFAGGRKYVILDEADYLVAKSTQPALRNFIEENSKNCGFILTCNYKNKIIEPLHSRCTVIDFKIPKSDMQGIVTQFFRRSLQILDAENVTYDKAAVAKLVQTYYPDWRRTINELQRYSATGHIDEGILVNTSENVIMSLLDLMKAKDFTGVRRWLAENSDMDSSELYDKLYSILPGKLSDTQSVAGMIVVLAEYQYKEAFVANSEINRAAAMATLMAEMSWK